MASQSPSTKQVFLGVFIVGQLLFLVSANLISFLKHARTNTFPEVRPTLEALAPGWEEAKGHLWSPLEHLEKTDAMWAQATGQFQSWSLFAPTIGRECVFPSVELRWDEDPTSAPALARNLALLSASNSCEFVCLGAATGGAKTTPIPPVLVISENEPANPEHYLRIGNFRLRRFENNLVLTLLPHEDEKPEKTNERWSDWIHSHVADYREILHGYLRWRLDKAQAEVPGRPPPRQVILFFRRYHINDYEKAPPFWTGPDVVPIARWQPAAFGDSANQTIEWYDPLTKRFKSLAK
jgi:hypothetical protein